MAKKHSSAFQSPAPDLQIAFYHRLASIREMVLGEALRTCIDKIDLDTLDQESAKIIEPLSRKRLASFGLRSEVFFPLPSVLTHSPSLLGYYRLLYGLSQKEFYHKGPFTRFKRMEEEGFPSATALAELPSLCKSLAVTGAALLKGIDIVSLHVVHDLQLLTLGPQFRGSENTRIGSTAMLQVASVIEKLVEKHLVEKTNRLLLIRNASGLLVSIQIGADPDVLVVIKDEGNTDFVLSIEVKGGSDGSNIHNRLGEAEKSHLKAKQLGCHHLWTVVRVDVDLETAKSRSPTTTRFFHLEELLRPEATERKDFARQFSQLLGIPGSR